MNGLHAGKISLWDTAQYLDQFDVVLLSEARCSTWDDTLLPNHAVTFTAASEEGRAGEGIVIAVRKHRDYHAQDWASDTDSALWVKVQFEGSCTPLLIGSSYIPPAGSRQLQSLDLTSRFTALGAQVLAARAQGTVILAGDFNARVSALPDCSSSDARGCTDEGVNAHGLRLLELCKDTDMLLCTGRVPGDLAAVPTFKARANSQATRPDHVLVSVDTLPMVVNAVVNTGRQDSDHNPIEMTVTVNVAQSDPTVCTGQCLPRVKWQPTSRTAYTHALSTVAADSIEASRVHAAAGEVDAAFQSFDEGVRAAAAASGMPARHGRPPCARVDAPFFDAECRQLKRAVRARARLGGDPAEVRAMERLYHNTVRTKRRAHRLAQLRRLLDTLHTDPRAFWKQLKVQHSAVPEQLKPVQMWDGYIQRVANLQLPAIAELPPLSFPVQPPAAGAAALNAQISLEEVLAGLKKLQNGRAIGVQGLPAELLRYAKVEQEPGMPPPANVLAPVLVDVLNSAFLAGRVPASVNGSLITPVHKKGSKLDTLNYRPIAVTEPIMRLYASILNSRILLFTEGAALRADTQAGFRPKLSTVHQLFTLQHFIDRQSHVRQPLYCCFLDLKGAYDRVNRTLLWEVLRRLGIEGHILAAIQSLYANSTVAMKLGERRGQSLPSETGLKQGCPLSPTLFGLFADGLHRHLLQKCPGVGPQLRNGLYVPDLGYADDFALLATTPDGLQSLIDAAAEFCAQTGMIIGADKTKVVVFSPQLPGPYQWLCGGVPLDWVERFEYLGTVFTGGAGVNLTFGKLQRNMWGAWAQLRQQYGKLRCSLSVDLLLRLYDACVPPTACYGCEVWGLRSLPAGDSKKGRAALASAHLKILKDIAGVPNSVHTAILLKELGRRPLHHFWWRRIVTFWNNLAALPATSFHRQVALDDCWDAITRNVKNWAWVFMRGLRQLGYDFTIRFDTLEPVDIDAVMHLLDAPVLQVWATIDICPRTCPSSNATLCTYHRWFARPESLQRPGSLLQQPLSARCLRTFLRFRMGCHNLPVVLGRWERVPRAQRLCMQCDLGAVGDERHFVFECPALQNIRDHYLALFGAEIQTMQQFVWQLDIVSVAKFVMDCFDYLDATGTSNQP